MHIRIGVAMRPAAELDLPTEPCHTIIGRVDEWPVDEYGLSDKLSHQGARTECCRVKADAGSERALRRCLDRGREGLGA